MNLKIIRNNLFPAIMLILWIPMAYLDNYLFPALSLKVYVALNGGEVFAAIVSYYIGYWLKMVHLVSDSKQLKDDPDKKEA